MSQLDKCLKFTAFQGVLSYGVKSFLCPQNLSSCDTIEVAILNIKNSFDFWSSRSGQNYINLKVCTVYQIHGSQLRAFSRERSTQPPPRCKGSDRNKLHGAGSLFNCLLLKI